MFLQADSEDSDQTGWMPRLIRVFAGRTEHFVDFVMRWLKHYQLSLSMRHVMRKPVYAICEQQRRRSACASAQSDQRLCCSLPG